MKELKAYLRKEIRKVRDNLNKVSFEERDAYYGELKALQRVLTHLAEKGR